MSRRSERRPNTFAAGGLDRAPHRRARLDWLGEHSGAASSRLVPVWRSRSLVTSDEGPRAVTIAADRVGSAGDRVLPPVDRVGPVFLGLDGETALFAVDVSHLEDPLADLPARGAEFVDLHEIGALLGQVEGALLAYARWMVHWHRRHLYCGRCGSETRSEDAGHVRRCGDDACGILHFPRTDPAIIVLVADGEACLLGRQSTWPKSVYSTLAGFVEPGESLGEAVIREVREETGITVDDVRYHSSQPWPFPSSLMLGFTAAAARLEPVVDHSELEDARWFRRETLRHMVETEAVRLPRRVSIARRLIDEWLDAR